jgi:hypothetical protein
MEDIMRTTIITIAIAGLFLCAGIGCNNDKTELAWINDSDVYLNEIIWSKNVGNEPYQLNYDQKWTNGYSDGVRTEFKEVDLLNGYVYAIIEENNQQVLAEAIIENTTSNNVSLKEGSSEVYTITQTQ